MEMWYESGNDNHILVASRVRIARNLVDYPFPVKLDEAEAKKMTEETSDRVQLRIADDFGETYEHIDLYRARPVIKNALSERCSITPQLRDKKLPSGVLLSENESEAIMINEEDHFRIQSAAVGDALYDVYCKAAAIEDAIGSDLTFAYNHKYGYITSCPTSLGTGLRASYVMHLPFLEFEELIKPLSDELNRLGFMLRNMYGSSSRTLGSLYLLSNQRTLGMSEQDILESLRNMMVQVTEHERMARARILRKRRQEIQDVVCKSYGVLKYGMMFDTEEAMNHLSNIRFGLDEGLIVPKDGHARDIYPLMIGILPAMLMEREGKKLGSLDRHICRAKYIQDNFFEI